MATPDEIERTREKLRDAVWKAANAIGHITAEEAAGVDAGTVTSAQILTRTARDVDDALDALIAFERAVGRMDEAVLLRATASGYGGVANALTAAAVQARTEDVDAIIQATLEDA